MTVLELKGVTFQRDGKRILHDIDLRVAEGEHWALIGPNGAGKSTILGLCGAVIQPTSGEVHVLGKQLGHVELQSLRRHIGHVNPRHPVRPTITVHDVVLTGITGTIVTPPRWHATDEQSEQADLLIASLGLTEKRDERWQVLSQGERGRTLIARALITDPQLLLLDEPSTGLDMAAREQLLETIAALTESRPQLASVLVTHHLEELPQSSTHAFVIAHGAPVASGPIDAALTSASITEAFEHPIDVHHHDGRWSARSASVNAASRAARPRP
jgi:iron complex transport system ATP-binding protein